MEFEHVVSFHEAPWHYSLLSTSSSPVSLVHACALLAGARALSFRSLLPCVSLTLPDDAFFHWRLKFISSRICNPKIRNIHSSLLCPSLRPHWMQPPHLLSVFFARSARVWSSSAVKGAPKPPRAFGSRKWKCKCKPENGLIKLGRLNTHHHHLQTSFQGQGYHF